MNGNFNCFLKTDLRQFAGQWVIIVNEKIVKNGKDIKKMLKEVEEEYPKTKPLVAKVPENKYYLL
jgi:hypothetical protein